MDIRLLGPVEVWADGDPVDIGGRRPRGVLAALASDANRPLPIDVIIDRVWDDDPPAHARHTLHGYVTRLRRVLDAGGMRLSYRNGAYTLHTAADGVDLARVRLLADRARGRAVDADARATLLRQALGLWRGEPLGGLPGGWAAATRQRWTARRLDTAVQWAQAELGRAGADVVVEVLDPLVGEFPLSEPLTAVLMRALVAAGRGPEALECYAGLRRRLADELGCDPHPGLRQLHLEILRGGPAGADTVASGGAVAPAVEAAPRAERPVPAQLPADVRGFAGRADELHRLDALLEAAADEPTAMLISAVSGTAGVGKTALAIHWAHRVRDRFPDGQLYVNLRGFDPDGYPADPADAIRGLLDALGVSADRMPSDLDARVGLYRSLMAGRRALVVLDNARDAEQVRPLLPGTPTAVAVVTSRNKLMPLVAGVGAHPVDLDVLSLPESRELVRRRLGADAVAADPAAVDRIITTCARLPLALAVATARARQIGLAIVAAELADAGQRLDTLDAGDAASRVRAVFRWSYDTLCPDAARLFRLLGLHPGADIAVPAAASLVERPVGEVRRLLRVLTAASLVVEDAHGRFGFHDLLRAFAAELTHRLDTEENRRAAVARMLDHYVQIAHRSARLLGSRRRLPDPDPPDPGVTAPGPADRREAIDWFAAETTALLACIHLGAAAGLDRQTGQLADSLLDILDGQSRWGELEAVQRVAIASARRTGDRLAEAHARRGLAQACGRTGRHDEALDELRRADALFASLADPRGLSLTHKNLAIVYEALGRIREASFHAGQSLHFARMAADPSLEVGALNAVGWMDVMHGDPAAGLARCLAALTLSRRHSRRAEPVVLDSVGHAYLRLGRPGDAIDCFRQSIALHRTFDERRGVGTALLGLGDAHEAAGDRSAARRAWQQAQEIFGELRHPCIPLARARLSDHPADAATA
jgi:DNA-binding SARP family transcriptional activator/tetratricopeptide (TPR) repeat protein